MAQHRRRFGGALRKSRRGRGVGWSNVCSSNVCSVGCPQGFPLFPQGWVVVLGFVHRFLVWLGLRLGLFVDRVVFVTVI